MLYSKIHKWNIRKIKPRNKNSDLVTALDCETLRIKEESEMKPKIKSSNFVK